MVKVAPSLLSANFACLKDDIEKIENGKADWLHYDVMDGHFVPNISFGYSILKDVSKVTNLFLDVHLMISEPQKYVDEFIKSGANLIVFHIHFFFELVFSYRSLKDLVLQLFLFSFLQARPIHFYILVFSEHPLHCSFDLFYFLFLFQ